MRASYPLSGQFKDPRRNPKWCKLHIFCRRKPRYSKFCTGNTILLGRHRLVKDYGDRGDVPMLGAGAWRYHRALEKKEIVCSRPLVRLPRAGWPSVSTGLGFCAGYGPVSGRRPLTSETGTPKFIERELIIFVYSLNLFYWWKILKIRGNSSWK